MLARTLGATLIALAPCAVVPAACADAPKLAKEPTYQSKAPKYALLTFGSEAKLRIGLVLDGDTLYVDRNANGDLTEPGERLTCTKRLPEDGLPLQVFHQFTEVDVTGPEGKSPYRWLRVIHTLPNKDFMPKTKAERQAKEEFDQNPDPTPVNVSIVIEGKYRQSASIAFADRPKDAPVIPFDSKLSMELSREPILFRGGPATFLYAWIGTRVAGQVAVVQVHHDRVPLDIHPIVEIDFPPKNPADKPIRVSYVLNKRC